jgi:hypothetical protein
MRRRVDRIVGSRLGVDLSCRGLVEAWFSLWMCGAPGVCSSRVGV